MTAVTLIFPIYNQDHVLHDNIVRAYEYLTEREIDFQILVCNDGSTDNSPAIAIDLAQRYEKVTSIGYKRNRGRGYALKHASIRAAGKYLVCMDCDLLEPEYLHYIDEVINQLASHDVVIASRFHRDAVIKRKIIRDIVSKIYRFLIRIYFPNFAVTDPDVGFKGFNADVFLDVNMLTNLNGASWDLQFLVNASNEGYRIYELPFSYVEKYTRTTVNIVRCSMMEFLGLNYIWITSAISRRITF